MENETDLITIENGEVFYGTREQFRNCYFDNADNDVIIEWCKENNWDVKIETITEAYNRLFELTNNNFKNKQYV